jgi:hypothetical protein
MADRARYARSQAYAVNLGGTSLSWFTPPSDSMDPRRPWGDVQKPLFSATVDFGETSVSVGRGGSKNPVDSGFSLISDTSGLSDALAGAWGRIDQTFGMLTLDAGASRDSGRESLELGVSLPVGDGLARVGYRSTIDPTSSISGYLQSRFGNLDRSRLSAISVQTRQPLGKWTLTGHSEIAEVILEGVAASGTLTTGWMTSLERQVGGGHVRFSIRQPRRAETGSLTFMAPMEIDALGHIRSAPRTVSLSPSGRQIDLEAAWSSRLDASSTLEVIGALSSSPLHVRGAPAEGALWLSIRGVW